jgi:hypothetical protein
VLGAWNFPCLLFFLGWVGALVFGISPEKGSEIGDSQKKSKEREEGTYRNFFLSKNC